MYFGDEEIGKTLVPLYNSLFRTDAAIARQLSIQQQRTITQDAAAAAGWAQIKRGIDGHYGEVRQVLNDLL